MRVILLRHGETDWNKARRIQGSADIPLNDTGRAQARAAGTALRTRLEEIALESGTDASAPAVYLAASDLGRAVETARIVGAEIGADGPATYRALRERAYGEAEGMDIAASHARYARTDDIPGAETDAELVRRAHGGVLEAARDASAAGAGTLVAVAHGGLIRALIAEASEGSYPAPGHRIENGSAHEFALEDERLRLLSHASVPA